MSQLIQSQLASVRRRSILIGSGTGVALSVIAFVVILVVGMLVDWWIELPYLARAVMLAGNLCVAGYLLVRYAVFPILFAPDDDELALRIERWQPRFQTRLIAAVQLSRQAPAPGISQSMVHALVDETEELARAVAFERVVQPDPLLRSGGIALAMILLALIGLGYNHAVAMPLLQRALIVPNVAVPRKTQVRITSGDMVVARGESVTLSATARGVIPGEGVVELGYGNGRTVRFTMTPLAEGRDQFIRRIDHIQESFTYRVTLNDGTSDTHEVTVAERPAVSELRIAQDYPAYTNLGTVDRSPGDLTILSGSRLHLDITATKPVRRVSAGVGEGNYLHLLGAEVDLPLVVDPKDPTRLGVVEGGRDGFTLPATTTGFSIHLVDENGLRSVDPVVYRVEVRPDEPPSVRVTHPRQREELVTQQATIVVGFDAADDFALGRLALRYKIRRDDAVDANGAPAPDGGHGDGLSATYFGEPDFKGRQFKRIDPRIDFDWGGGAPAPGIGADQFTARWEGQVQPRYSEVYTFIMRADDDCRLWVNDRLLIDQFPGKYDEEYTASIPLEANVKYNIRAEMGERWGNARAHLWWSSPSQAREIIPQSRLYSTVGETRPAPPEAPETIALGGDGVNITYFTDPELKEEQASAALANVDAGWQVHRRPEGLPEKFSARFTGYFIPRYSGLYTLYTMTDDGIRFWIDEELLIDKWKQNAREQLLVRSLDAGKIYSFKYEMNNHGGGHAEAHLAWQSDEQKNEPIPRDRLFTTREKAEHAVRRIEQRRAEEQQRLAAIQEDDPGAHTVVLEMQGTPRSMRGHYPLDLKALSPAPPVGSIIEWWVQAIDTNDVTGPGKAVSDHYLARVVTPEAKRADLLGQAADTFDNMRGVTETQEQLNQRLGDLLTGRPENP